ncbi:maltokinase N-terminal cap-like domain-containing protein [Streptomyces sp. PR69]|uniref:maltokinase N-terminal cap-like domain-containing protein n=1 Tax=Streptomyces sp. PR69 TaxID=2984950 RepID=UPI00226563CD|nr:maltokinase [Streptomyces sp. PR69]
MSEGASSRTPVAHVAHVALIASLAPLLHRWLPRQRWYAGKGRPVTGFSLVSATELLPADGPGAGLLHLLLRVRQQEPREQEFRQHETRQHERTSSGAGRRRQSPDDCYQLFLGVRQTLPPHLAPALIGHLASGPLAGRTVYEGLHDPRLAELLLERLRAPGALGPLRFDRFDGTPAVPGGLAPRPLDAEQSNTSLVYGDAYILKLFRRVHPGPNPDLELPLALARAGCGRAPAPVAWYEAHTPEPYTLGVLQPFLRGSQDAWVLALKALAEGEPFTAEARALGRVTAEVHQALAGELPTVTLHRPQTEQLAAAMRRRLDAAAEAVPALTPYVPRLRTAFEAVAELGRRGRVWCAQRVHGDLHLGQILRGAREAAPGPALTGAPDGGPGTRQRPAGDGHWSVIDFEGEPARPLTERRRPQPAVRDVAGMLRSFDYAARTHRPWNPDWAERCRDAYCEGYAEVSGADPRLEMELLRAYETDKAVYEAVYEARHRPDWLPVPMAAIDRLAAALTP